MIRHCASNAGQVEEVVIESKAVSIAFRGLCIGWVRGTLKQVST